MKYKAEVKINNDCMEQIEMNLGVRQDDSLLATLFLLGNRHNNEKIGFKG